MGTHTRRTLARFATMVACLFSLIWIPAVVMPESQSGNSTIAAVQMALAIVAVVACIVWMESLRQPHEPGLWTGVKTCLEIVFPPPGDDE
jgi:uncharacterized membrane protein